MPEREALIVDARGERFRFYRDPLAPNVLHIQRRHQMLPSDAIRVFFTGATEWNEQRARFETEIEGVVLSWTRHAHEVLCWSLPATGDEKSSEAN